MSDVSGAPHPAPTWDQYMAPTLRLLLDGEVHRGRELVQGAADLLGLTPQQRSIMIPSGQEQWVNRGNWALSYLFRAGATERPQRGQHRITDVGRKLLAEHPEAITEKDLRILAGLPDAGHTGRALRAAADARAAAPELESDLEPEEQIASGIERIRVDVADRLMKRLLEREPAFFERAVVDLLMAMGY